MIDRQASLQDQDSTVHELIRREAARQESGLELIASENFTSRAVMEAAGTELTNKYAEGYPGRRYYGGCEVVDEVERLAISRVLELFGAEHANVQPHSGAQANFAAFLAVLGPGDPFMGLALPHGGHLTHGSSVNVSGRLFRPIPYHVDVSTGLIDMDEVRDLARRERPKLIVCGGSAYPRIIDFEAFAEVAAEVDATLMVDMAHFAGLVAGGVHPSPIPHAGIVTSTTHKTLRGPRGGFILSREALAKPIDKQVFPGSQGGPLLHVIAAKAVAFHEALQPAFKEYAAQVVRNAITMCEALVDRGYDLVSGGTDTHVLLVDLRSRDLTGKKAEELLGRAGIHVNKNTIPGETLSPFVTSGIRLGTPAVTTRGMGVEEMRRIVDFIDSVLTPPDDDTVGTVAAEVREMTAAFPLHAGTPQGATR